MTTIPIRLRQRAILDAQLAQCQRVDNSFTRGAVAALHWLTEGGVGPLSGALATSITLQAIVHELAAAEAIIYGPPSTGREYARGVEHALSWRRAPRPGRPSPPPADPTTRHEERNPRNGGRGR